MGIDLCTGVGTLLPSMLEFMMILTLAAFLLFGPAAVATRIYRIFPESQTWAEGPFRGFKVRTTGAFAGFVVIFVAYLPLLFLGYRSINRETDTINNRCRPGWTVKLVGTVFEDEGKQLGPDETSSLIEKLSLSPPQCYEHTLAKIAVRIPEEKQSEFPTSLLFKIDKNTEGVGYIGELLNLNKRVPDCIKEKEDAPGICIDRESKTILVNNHVLRGYGHRSATESGANPANYIQPNAAFTPTKQHARQN